MSEDISMPIPPPGGSSVGETSREVMEGDEEEERDESEECCRDFRGSPDMAVDVDDMMMTQCYMNRVLRYWRGQSIAMKFWLRGIVEGCNTMISDSGGVK
jgi:hypothetical protein